MKTIDKEIKELIKLSKTAEITKDKADSYGHRLMDQLSEKILEKIVGEKLLNKVQWHVDYRYDSSMSRIYSRIDNSWDHIVNLYKATDKLRWGHCALQITPKIRLQFDDSRCAELLAQNLCQKTYMICSPEKAVWVARDLPFENIAQRPCGDVASEPREHNP